MRTCQFGSVILLCLATLAGTGCQTDGQSGLAVGTGLGALAGQAIGGDTEATLLGAAIGAGVGYVIGNEQDKAKAKTMPYAHEEIGRLGGTRWQVISLAPRDYAPPYTSKIVEFRSNGRMVTTTTNPDGSVDVFNERYRVVGNTMVINRAGYLVNAEFLVDGMEMIIDADEFRAVLRRIAS